MAYSRGYRKNNQRYKRRNYRRKAPSAWSSAKNLGAKAYKLAKYVRSIVNVEYKYTDVAITGSLSTTPSITFLTDTVQGVTVNDRNGNSIKLKSMYISGIVYANTAATFAQNVRCIIFIDKDSRGAAPLATDLLTASTIQAPINLLNGKRFVVLMDKHINVGTQANTSAMHNFKYFKKFNMDLSYQASGGSAADADTNQIYMLLMCTNAANTPAVQLNSRIRFIDN